MVTRIGPLGHDNILLDFQNKSSEQFSAYAWAFQRAGKHLSDTLIKTSNGYIITDVFPIIFYVDMLSSCI